MIRPAHRLAPPALRWCLAALGAGLLVGVGPGGAPAGADIRRAGWTAPLAVFTLSSPKIHPEPRAVRLAHVAIAPGPASLARLRAAAPDAIVYSGPAHPPGAARDRLAALATLAPTWGLRDGATGEAAFAGTAVRTTNERLHLELAGQDLGLVCANGPVASWPGLLARLPSRDTFNVVVARTADGAKAAIAAGGPGVDLFLAATAGASRLPAGLSRQRGTWVHVSGGGAPALFVVGR